MNRRISDREVFPAVWILITFLLIGFVIWRFLLGTPTISGCWIYRNLQLYCPGCGGTRALEALLRGSLIQSLCYHPAVPLTFIWVFIYLLSQTIQRIRRGKGWALRYDEKWVILFFAVLVMNCIVRNVLLLRFSIKL